MSDLIQRITELEKKEHDLQGLHNFIFNELGDFIAAWDSGNPDALPANKTSMIDQVRRVYDYAMLQEKRNKS